MFHTLFFQPIYNVVVFFVNLSPSHDLGVAVILTTIFIKLILLPLNLSSQRSSYLIKEAQVEIDEIKEKHKGDNKLIATKTMELYKEKKIKPFSTFLTLIVQLPVFFALYYVFKDGIQTDQSSLYSFIKFPISINQLAFGFINLTQRYWWLGILTGLSMFVFSKRQADTMKKMEKEAKQNLSNKTNKKDENSFQVMFAKNMQTQMTYFLPIISGLSAAVLPAVLGIYWTINNILNIFQDIYIKRKLNIEKFIKNHNN